MHSDSALRCSGLFLVRARNACSPRNVSSVGDARARLGANRSGDQDAGSTSYCDGLEVSGFERRQPTLP